MDIEPSSGDVGGYFLEGEKGGAYRRQEFESHSVEISKKYRELKGKYGESLLASTMAKIDIAIREADYLKLKLSKKLKKNKSISKTDINKFSCLSKKIKSLLQSVDGADFGNRYAVFRDYSDYSDRYLILKSFEGSLKGGKSEEKVHRRLARVRESYREFKRFVASKGDAFLRKIPAKELLIPVSLFGVTLGGSYAASEMTGPAKGAEREARRMMAVECTIAANALLICYNFPKTIINVASLVREIVERGKIKREIAKYEQKLREIDGEIEELKRAGGNSELLEALVGDALKVEKKIRADKEALKATSVSNLAVGIGNALSTALSAAKSSLSLAVAALAKAEVAATVAAHLSLAVNILSPIMGVLQMGIGGVATVHDIKAIMKAHREIKEIERAIWVLEWQRDPLAQLERGLLEGQLVALRNRRAEQTIAAFADSTNTLAGVAKVVAAVGLVATGPAAPPIASAAGTAAIALTGISLAITAGHYLYKRGAKRRLLRKKEALQFEGARFEAMVKRAAEEWKGAPHAVKERKLALLRITEPNRQKHLEDAPELFFRERFAELKRAKER